MTTTQVRADGHAGPDPQPSAPRARSAWLRELTTIGARSILTVLGTLALLATAPMAVGMTSTTVMSNSMAPSLHAGDVVLVRPSDGSAVHAGQVLLVHDPDSPGRLRLHRLVGEERGRLALRGDANAQTDPSLVPASSVVGVGVLRVPAIGLLPFWIRSGAVPLVMTAGAGLVVTAALAGMPLTTSRRGVDPPRGQRRRGSPAGTSLSRPSCRRRPARRSCG